MVTLTYTNYLNGLIMNGIVVLISGRGSNLGAICEAGLSRLIKCVISNRADAEGLTLAQEYNISSHVIEHKQFPNRETFDQELAKCIDSYNPKLVVLAGFMRILSSEFVNRYHNRLLNIHPSLLPSFIGTNAQGNAVASKVKVSGATVHFVTEELDHGPIIAQGVVGVKISDNKEDLAQRILGLEHVIYPFVIKKILADEVVISSDGQVTVTYKEKDKEYLGKYQEHVYY